MEPLALLKKLVSIKSVYGSEGKIGEYVEERLKECGFKVRRMEISPGRFNVIGERGSRGKPILLYGHIDTVPPYGRWKGSPYSLTLKNGKLMGLGAFDMKAGVAAILCACAEKTDRRIRVVFCADEENISEGAYLASKRGVFDGVEAAVSAEISTGIGKCLGTGEITLGRRGRCVIEIEVPGKSAHGAKASQGVNALVEASRLAIELEKLNGSLGRHPLLPPPTLFVRKICGESTSLSVPEKAHVEVDMHLVAPQTPQSAEAMVRKFIGKLYSKGTFSSVGGKRITAKLKVRKTPYLKPYLTSKNNRYVKMLSSIVKKRHGKVKYSYGASVADDNVLAEHAPTMSIGPLGGGEHTCREWVSKKSYLELVGILKEFVKGL